MRVWQLGKVVLYCNSGCCYQRTDLTDPAAEELAEVAG